jgi:5-formyltetrahydrofolate cyclo-ligase
MASAFEKIGMNAKEKLREEARATLKKFGAHEILQKSDAISARLESLPEFSSANFVLMYAATEREPQTKSVIARSLARGKRIFLPKFDEKLQKYVAVSVKNLSDLQRGKHGILEPLASDVADFAKLDVVVMPGLAFDARGNRLGRGAGVFDRMSREAVRAVKIGLAFDVQIVREVPAEPHDVVLDIIVTETKLIRR